MKGVRNWASDIASTDAHLVSSRQWQKIETLFAGIERMGLYTIVRAAAWFASVGRGA